jgi:hypothetical protein
MSDDSSHAVLFREVVCRNYLNLTKILREGFEKVAVLFFEAHVRGRCIWI